MLENQNVVFFGSKRNYNDKKHEIPGGECAFKITQREPLTKASLFIVITLPVPNI